MNVMPATQNNINRWHSTLLDTCTDRQQWVQVVPGLPGLGGDQLYAIQDGGGFFAKDGDEIVGVVSYSIGLWVKDHNIVAAAMLIKHVIDTLVDTLQVDERTVVDSLWPPEKATPAERLWAKIAKTSWTCIAIPLEG